MLLCNKMEINSRAEHLKDMKRNFGKGIVKAKDISGYLGVRDYLSGKGLDFRLAGTIKKNAHSGVSRHYRTINMLVLSTNDKYLLNSVKEELRSVVEGNNIFNGFDWISYNITEQRPSRRKELSVGTGIDTKFMVKFEYNGKSRTLVNICFEENF